jgi:hypothetical protein
MNVKVRNIEVDAETADLLEARAAALGMSVSALLAEIAGREGMLPPDLANMRAKGTGPWSADALEQDARRLASSSAPESACLGTRSRPGWKAGARRTSFRGLGPVDYEADCLGGGSS